MASSLAALGLELAPQAINNYGPIKRTIKKRIPIPGTRRRGPDNQEKQDFVEIDEYEGNIRGRNLDDERDRQFQRGSHEEYDENRGYDRLRRSNTAYGERDRRDLLPPDGDLYRPRTIDQGGYYSSRGSRRGRGDPKARGGRRHYDSESNSDSDSDSSSSFSPPLSRNRRRTSPTPPDIGKLNFGTAEAAAAGVAYADRDRSPSHFRRGQSRPDFNHRASSYSPPRNRGFDGGAMIRNGNGNNGPPRGRSERGGDDSHSRSSSSSSSVSISSSEDERRARKAKWAVPLTAGLAAVATVHAAAGIRKSMDAHDERHRKLREGKITRDDARKLKQKTYLQDAAALGIAAMSVKGAYSEWKEMGEHRKRYHEQKEAWRKRHEKRLKKERKRREQSRGPRPGYGRRESNYYSD
ncbi:MAG: hypothetical protein M1834_008766 [Cirrosporium novae-zelandiae]|nr:MAG: hypothetical protein M1834_008766 [Cirrosporium novae-zelandiae]